MHETQVGIRDGLMIQLLLVQRGRIAAQPGYKGLDGSGKFQVLKIQLCHADVGGMMELVLRQRTILKGLE